MRQKRGKFSQSSPKSGLTLLEVLAALAILATLLSGLLLAKGRAQRQQTSAVRRMAAIAAADRLVGDWWTRSGVPDDSDGIFPDDPSLRWSTRIIERTEVPVISEIVRLEVLGASDNAVLTSVNLWVSRAPAVAEPTSPKEEE